jgi:hypothetical protein
MLMTSPKLTNLHLHVAPVIAKAYANPSRNVIYQAGGHRFLMQGKSERIARLTKRLRTHAFCLRLRSNTEGAGAFAQPAANAWRQAEAGRSTRIQRRERRHLSPAEFR